MGRAGDRRPAPGAPAGEVARAVAARADWRVPVTVTVEDQEHPATRHLPPSFEVADELYTFRTNPRESAHVLLSAPSGSLDLEGDLPLAWTRSHGSGRVYYNASTLLCVPNALSQPGGYALGAQAGEAAIRRVVTDAGFTRFRRAAETPFNLVYEVRP